MSEAVWYANPVMRSFLAGLAGFVAYGGWAFYANSSHGDMIALRSGVVQGSYSFVLTFVMTIVTEWLFTKLYGKLLWLPTLMVIVCSVLFTTAYTINMIAGTPEILMTIFPGFVIGSIYTLIYVIGLSKKAG